MYLLEPALDPSVEQQAVARVHRIGQEREVTITRLVIEDTVEQEVGLITGVWGMHAAGFNRGHECDIGFEACHVRLPDWLLLYAPCERRSQEEGQEHEMHWQKSALSLFTSKTIVCVCAFMFVDA